MRLWAWLTGTSPTFVRAAAAFADGLPHPRHYGDPQAFSDAVEEWITSEVTISFSEPPRSTFYEGARYAISETVRRWCREEALAREQFLRDAQRLGVPLGEAQDVIDVEASHSRIRGEAFDMRRCYYVLRRLVPGPPMSAARYADELHALRELDRS